MDARKNILQLPGVAFSSDVKTAVDGLFLNEAYV